MGLEARLRQLELKVRLVNIASERLFDIDQYIVQLGLDPVAVRESARRTSSSLVEVVSAMLGIEPREFARLLKEKANLAR